ncbi:MBL fold metallo-hydrolase [Rhodohalobacter sp. 8-1]|uniref:MBL fold metallo-hydrolase n=1 Tax=Rhodohalobacter sp. 8-1 TaxID=3131972 RepID=UPI0030EEB189
MKLTFLGTRGYIEETSSGHQMHSSLMVSYKGKEVMIDCGLDWIQRLKEINPPAIVLTHAHPDHAFGLQNGAPCPVYATTETLDKISDYGLDETFEVKPGKPFDVRGITFTAYSVEHSTKAPSVGYKIKAGTQTVFYVPDVVYIHDREDALSGCDAYIGDGSTVSTSFVRKQGENLIGHTPVRTQLTWCRKFDIPKAFITHCGSEIVEGGEKVKEKIMQEAQQRNIEAVVATDGMEHIPR